MSSVYNLDVRGKLRVPSGFMLHAFIDMPDDAEIPPIISLHRYFCAAARMQKFYQAAVQSPELANKKRTLAPDMFGVYLHSGPPSVLYYWYGALFVVKEGYDDLRLRDAQVDALLASTEKVEALKRCRNGAFHFQKNYFDERFLGPMREEGFVQWVHALMDAFKICIESVSRGDRGNTFTKASERHPEGTASPSRSQ
jgi:hypothetical protein